MKWMIASDIHGSALFCRRLLAAFDREGADRLVLLVDEDGRLKCKPANQKATQLAPADVTANGKLPIVGAAVLMFQRGDELLGFSKHVADTICSEWLE